MQLPDWVKKHKEPRTDIRRIEQEKQNFKRQVNNTVNQYNIQSTQLQVIQSRKSGQNTTKSEN